MAVESPKARIIETLKAKGRYYTESEWSASNEKPVVQTIRHHFGSWADAWVAAGITPDRLRARLSKDKILQVLTDFGRYCTARDWDEAGHHPTSRTIRKVFGTWKDAWIAAGVPYPASQRIVTYDAMVKALQSAGTFVPAQLWDASGRIPSSHTIRKCFGSWDKAWEVAGIPVDRPGSSIVLPHETPSHSLNQTDAELWSRR
jgi:hypothetical protein